tara:strand:- start:346 stop:567 length:222 start_codon:yes stop_codon:yes gene_type:complete
MSNVIITGTMTAYPVENCITDDSGRYEGLTKREAFTMAAMQGILSHSFGRGDADELAVQSAKCADALLKELAK